MAEIKKINTEFQLLDKFLDTSGDAGASGQVLSSTASGVNWVSGGSLPGGPYLPLAGGTLTGTLTVGADASGHDVVFYGNATGEKMIWNHNSSRLQINHDTDDSGLDIFTVSSSTMTQPQLRVGRDQGQYWGVYTDDRNAHLVHRQDETTGIMTTRFDQWDSNTGDATGEWQWRSGNGTGASMTNALVLTQAGNATFEGTLTSGTHTINSGNDAILTLNQTGTDTGWSYINFNTSGTRNYYVGQDSQKNWEVYNDNLNVVAISVKYATNFVNIGGDLTVEGGDITLSGTGRIQGIDTVSASTDAANKAYVDAHGGGLGPFLPLAGGTMTGTAGVLMPDNFKLNLGTSSDLQIYHDGSNSFMVDAGAGDMLHYYSNDWKVIKYGTGELSIWATTDAGVKLYYDNVKKFETTSTGVTVAGNISFGDSHFIGDDADDNLLIQGSASENVIIRSEDGLYFRTGGNNTRLSINSSGKVGIGTTSPEAKLTIKGDALNTNQPVRITNSVTDTHTGLFLNNTGSTVGEKYGMQFGGYNQYSIGGIFGVLDSVSGSTSGDITFDLGNGTSAGSLIERMRITHEGNVGIGTTSPDTILHVKGSTDSTEVKIDTNDNALGDNALIKFNGERAQVGWIDAAVTLTDGGGNKDIKLKVNTGSIFLQTNNTNRLSVLDGGNVGIGTNSPGQKLDVNGSINVSSNVFAEGFYGDRLWNSNNAALRFGTNNTERARIDGNGNLGIGTTAPTNKLHIQGSQATVYSSTDSGGQASAGTTINNTNTSGNTNNFSQLLFTVGTNNNSLSRIVAIRSGSDASDLAFVGKSAAGVAEYMRIKSGGNVGIGTTSPGSSLEVLKSASSTTISEARISSLVTGGYGGQANLWLRTSTYGSAMLAFGPQVGSSTVASSASGKISYNTFNRTFTVTADSNALLTLGGSNDRVGINQTSPQYTLDVTGNGRFTSTVTATNFINSSDERLKENIEEVRDNNVEVNWKTFNFKTEKEQKRYGVIAQELEKTNPEFVREDSKGFKSVAYIDLLIAKIAELEARIQKLENK